MFNSDSDSGSDSSDIPLIISPSPRRRNTPLRSTPTRNRTRTRRNGNTTSNENFNYQPPKKNLLILSSSDEESSDKQQKMAKSGSIFEIEYSNDESSSSKPKNIPLNRSRTRNKPEQREIKVTSAEKNQNFTPELPKPTETLVKKDTTVEVKQEPLPEIPKKEKTIETKEKEVQETKITNKFNEKATPAKIVTIQKPDDQITSKPKKKKLISRSEFLSREFKKPTIIYRINRKKSFGVPKTILFTLYQKDVPVACAKGKGLSISKLFIKLGDTIHLSQPPFDGIFTTSGLFDKNVKLYRGNEEKEENVIMQAVVITGASINPKHLEFDFIGETPENFVQHLESRMPTYNEEKKVWQLDFYGKFVMKSSKNCILDGKKMKRAIIIRKTTANDLEIEVLKPLDTLYVMMFALTAYMC